MDPSSTFHPLKTVWQMEFKYKKKTSHILKILFPVELMFNLQNATFLFELFLLLLNRKGFSLNKQP